MRVQTAKSGSNCKVSHYFALKFLLSFTLKLWIRLVVMVTPRDAALGVYMAVQIAIAGHTWRTMGRWTSRPRTSPWVRGCRWETTAAVGWQSLQTAAPSEWGKYRWSSVEEQGTWEMCRASVLCGNVSNHNGTNITREAWERGRFPQWPTSRAHDYHAVFPTCI